MTQQVVGEAAAGNMTRSLAGAPRRPVVLEWLHNTGCPWDAVMTCAGRWWRAPGVGEVAAQPWLPVG
jgi:hypothetical protein